MLLLDDVFDKLDSSRVKNLLSLVSGSDFGQIFITDCDRERLRNAVDGISASGAFFETVDGCFNRL